MAYIDVKGYEQGVNVDPKGSAPPQAITTSIDKLRENPLYKTIIVLPDNEVITQELGLSNRTVAGFMIEQFTMSGSNEFTDLWGMTESQRTASKAVQMFELFSSELGANNPITNFIETARNDFIGSNITNVNQTISLWLGCSKSKFNLDLLFLSTNKDYDPRVPASLLLAGVYPERAELGQNAPYGYKPSADLIAGNNSGGDPSKLTCSIQIGQWIRMTKMLIVSVSVTFSKQVSKYGYPLWARASVDFAPYRQLFRDEIQGFLSQNTGPIRIPGANTIPQTQRRR